MKQIKLVIFDWAGTTVDYGCFAPVNAFKAVFIEKGIEPTIEEVRSPMGILKREHIKTMAHMPRIERLWIEKYGSPADEGAIDSMFSSYEIKLLGSLRSFTRLKPHLLTCIDALRAKGITIGSTTGYTDKMMDIVTSCASSQGYSPDFWISPDSANGLGRPYPYMIFENMKQFKIKNVEEVIKVGDTLSDIYEGKNAGVFSVGVIEGSSEMGLTEKEYACLSNEEKESLIQNIKKRYLNAGADAVILNLSDLLPLIESLCMLK